MLVHPLIVIQDLAQIELMKLIGNKKMGSNIFVYREYDKLIREIHEDIDLKFVYKQIQFNEYPDVLTPTKSAMKLLLDF